MSLTPFTDYPGGSQGGSSGSIKGAMAYDEPEVRSITLLPGVPQLIYSRDIQRALCFFALLGVAVEANICIDSNCIVPVFQLGPSNTELLIRYVDFLTVVTGELYALSTAGAVATAVSVREH